MVFITRHHLERDEGIVYPIGNNGMSYRRPGLAPQFRGGASEMVTQESAYNGGAQTLPQFGRTGNTVGSLSGEERAIIVGCLLGDSARLNKDKQYARIRISVESVSRLYQIVKPSLLSMFDYKFPLMTP